MEPQPASTLAPIPPAKAEPPRSWWSRVGRSIRTRILGGLLVILPFVITIWVFYWLYTLLERHIIDPLAQFVMWKVRGGRFEEALPPWFEVYAAPVIAIVLALLLLYTLGFFVHSRVRKLLDWLFLRLPVVSSVYKGVQQVVSALDKKSDDKPRPQRIVLVPFPHTGMKVPAFVTGSCRDIETQKVILCVYVPTTPVPTSGYFLLVPEADVTELNWSPEEALQTIISGGFTAPPEVTFNKPAALP